MLGISSHIMCLDKNWFFFGRFDLFSFFLLVLLFLLSFLIWFIRFLVRVISKSTPYSIFRSLLSCNQTIFLSLFFF